MLIKRDILTTQDVADYLGITPRTVRDWARDQKIPGKLIQRRWIFKREDFLKFLTK